MNKIIKTSAPGKVMLLGEHAVLYGYPAIVCAINKRVFVTLTPRVDKKIYIFSELGTHKTDLSTLIIKKPFQFVITAIRYYKELFDLNIGFDLEIKSEFSEKIGFGSSAAVTVATLSAIQQLINRSLDFDFLHKAGVQVVREVQGSGSGGDVAASVYGGIIYYHANSFKIEKIKSNPQINLIYSGYKISTVDVINKVSEIAKNYPKIFAKLFAGIGQCVESGKKALISKNWKKLGQIFNIHQGLLDALGVNNKIISELIYVSRQVKGVLGSKISGSGLGDCLLVLSDSKINNFKFSESQKSKNIHKISVVISEKGVITL